MKKLIFIFLCILCWSPLQASSSQDNPPATIHHLDVKKYMGKWYEIASFPNRFQKGCRCTYAEYILGEKGKFSVINRCIKGSNTTFSKATGKAWIPNKADSGKLKVQFFWPFRGNYWILYLSPDYQYVLVGDPKRKYLWILSRTPTMHNDTYLKLLNIAKERGYKLDRLKRTTQNCWGSTKSKVNSFTLPIEQSPTI